MVLGIKHVVTNLSETEGLTLVALCATLTTTYDSTYAARVLRELYVLQRAPPDFSPALRQWKATVELCSGILTSSHLVLILNGFRRLILSQPDMPNLKYGQHPKPPTVVAEAILILARVSRKNLVSTTFTGALDCAWLAALAEWVLSLDVGIFSSSGLSLYRSRLGTGVLPQVTIVCSGGTTTEMKADLTVSRALVVPYERSIVHVEPEFETNARPGTFLNWRSSWSSILLDTFHGEADRLLTDGTGRQFALCLESIVFVQKRKPRGKESVDEDFPVDSLLRVQEDSHGRKFLAFASKQLPEVATSLSLDYPIVTKEEDAYRLGGSSLKSLCGVCSCPTHRHRQQGAREAEFCLEVIAETILVFLWILLASSIDNDIIPLLLVSRTFTHGCYAVVRRETHLVGFRRKDYHSTT